MATETVPVSWGELRPGAGPVSQVKRAARAKAARGMIGRESTMTDTTTTATPAPVRKPRKPRKASASALFADRHAVNAPGEPARRAALATWAATASQVKTVGQTSREAQRAADCTLGGAIQASPASQDSWLETARALGVKITDSKITRLATAAGILACMDGSTDPSVYLASASDDDRALAIRSATVLGRMTVGATVATIQGDREKVTARLTAAMTAKGESVDGLLKTIAVPDKAIAGLTEHAKGGRVDGEALAVLIAKRDALSRVIAAVAV